jgi:hypothetical protein
VCDGVGVWLTRCSSLWGCIQSHKAIRYTPPQRTVEACCIAVINRVPVWSTGRSASVVLVCVRVRGVCTSRVKCQRVQDELSVKLTASRVRVDYSREHYSRISPWTQRRQQQSPRRRVKQEHAMLCLSLGAERCQLGRSLWKGTTSTRVSTTTSSSRSVNMHGVSLHTFRPCLAVAVAHRAPRPRPWPLTGNQGVDYHKLFKVGECIAPRFASLVLPSWPCHSVYRAIYVADLITTYHWRAPARTHTQSFLRTGYQATNFGRAVEEIERMRRWRLSDEPIKEDESDDLRDPAVRESIRCKIFFGCVDKRTRIHPCFTCDQIIVHLARERYLNVTRIARERKNKSQSLSTATNQPASPTRLTHPPTHPPTQSAQLHVEPDLCRNTRVDSLSRGEQNG